MTKHRQDIRAQQPRFIRELPCSKLFYHILSLPHYNQYGKE